jgi:rubredoxin
MHILGNMHEPKPKGDENGEARKPAVVEDYNCPMCSVNKEFSLVGKQKWRQIIYLPVGPSVALFQPYFIRHSAMSYITYWPESHQVPTSCG